MSSLGSLYYTLGLKDLTDADFQRINAKLEKSGCTIKLTPELLKPVTDIIPKWVSIDINPNQVEQAKLDNAINGKVMHAEVLPLADKLKSAVVDALKSQQVPLEGITIPPDKIAAAVTNALSSANFTAVGDKAGDEIAKAIKVKVEGEKYNVTLTPDVSKLTKIVNDALDKIFAKEQKIKLDRSDIKAFRDELKNKVGEAIKITPTINLTQEAINKAVEGKVMRIEVLPLIDKLRKAIKDATTQSPAEIEVGVQETKLRNLINNILGKQGFMISIKTVDDNYTKVVQQKLNGRIYTVKIHADAREISRSVQTSLMNIQSRSFGLQVSKDILRQSIETALMGKPFNIQIAVMHDQARRAVQNALNNARMVGKDDALAFQRLQTGELRAAQAELARLKAAHQSAASAANTHASASINLGGALGSNIKIVSELGAAIASLYSVHAAKKFLSQVIEIGGELEHQKIALETIYGTESKMESLYGQIKSLARQSPFGVMELTKNVKQLSAYGVAYNEVYDTAKRLADISAATSVDIQRLILAFGKTKNRTFLDGLEAKQFAYANIPIYDMLSKKLTELEGKFVSVKDVMGRIKKQEIGFDMVKDILWDMTDEGGKFYNMQEKLAGSVKTSWKLVKDNIDLMFGEIAEGEVGHSLKWLAEVLQGLTKEWKTLAWVIAAAVGVFGIAKVASLLTARSLDATGTSALKAAANEALLERRNLRLAQSYRTLTAEEQYALSVQRGMWGTQKNLLKSLTSEQFKNLASTRKITKAEWERMVALGRLNKAQKAILDNLGILTTAEQNNIRVLGKWERVAFGVGNAMRSIGRSLATFFLNPVMLTMTAISGLVALLEKHHERVQKIKESAKEFNKKGLDGYEDMSKKLKELDSFDVSTASSSAINAKIEEMKTTLKDYSLTAEDTFRTVFGPDADGKIMSQREQFEALRQAIHETANAYKAMQNGKQSSIFTSDAGNNVSKAGEKFDKSISDTAEAYGNIIENVSDIDKILSQIEMRQANLGGGTIVDKKTTQEVKDHVNSLATLEEKLEYLQKVNVTFKGGKNPISTYLGYLYAQKIREEETVKSINGYISYLENRHKAINPDFKLATATREEKEKFLQEAKAFVDAQEKWSEQMKTLAMNMSFEAVGIESTRISDMYAQLFQNVNKEIGSELATKVKDGIELSAEEKTKVDNALKKAYNAMFKNAPRWMQEALQKAFLSKNKNGEWDWDATKIANLELRMQVTPELDDWQNEIYKQLGGEPEIKTWLKGTADLPSFVKAVQDGYKSAKTKLDTLKPLMLKAGISFESGKLLPQGYPNKWYANLSEAGRKMVDEYNEITREINAAQKASEEYGFELKEPKKKSGSKGTQKDEFAENLKQRFKDIKDAWSEFQKWSKTEGREAAANRVGDSGLFSTLPKEKIPKTVEEYRALIAELEKELQAAGIKGHSQRESLLNELLKQLLDIDKTVVDEQLKLALDKVSKEAERQIADWNLFDKIRKATGNQDLAMSIAFGLNDDAKTDYPTLVKNQFNEVAKATKSTLTFDTATPELLKEAPDEVQKAWEKAYSDIQKYRDKEREDVADMVAQYRNTQEEIVALTAEAEEKKRKIRENKDLSPVQKQQITDRIDADLNYQIFQKSGEYLKFFNAILSMTGKEAEDVGKKIKEALDQKLQAGTISAKDYCEEMEKIDKQLEIIRTKQKGFGGFGSFAKGGLQQMFQDRFEQAQSDYNKAVQDFDTAKQQFDIFSKEGNEAGMKQAQSAMDSASAMQEGASAAMEGAQGAMQTVAVIDTVVHGINDTVQGIRDAFYSIQDMADSFGVDTSADTDWGAAGAFLDAFSQASEGATKAWDSLKSGNIGGVISGVVQSVTSWFTVFNQWHDAKLQKQIERSQEIVDNIQRAYDKIERRMANFLGNGKGVDIFNSKQMQSELKRVNAEIAKFEKIRRDSKSQGIGTKKVDKELEALYKERESYKERIDAYDEGGAYALQRQMMKEQLAEMEEQKADMEAMKKKDPEAIADLEDQIDEMKVKIQDFAEEVAKDLYGIDLKGWASQIGDAIVDAFAAGEDAAEAFDKTVADIMRSVVKSMISVGVIQPAMEDLRDYLFGDNGVFSKGINGGDFELSKEDAVGLSNKLSGLKGSVEDAKAIYDYINDLTGGMLDDAEKSKSGMTAGLQSLTEDTGDLLVSYVNGMRGDLSVIRADWEVILSEVPQMNIIAEAQLTAQRQIAENTLRNAIAAEALLVMAGNLAKSNDDIHRLLNRATQGGVKFYIH